LVAEHEKQIDDKTITCVAENCDQKMNNIGTDVEDYNTVLMPSHAIIKETVARMPNAIDRKL
jgi:hypothetical protein